MSNPNPKYNELQAQVDDVVEIMKVGDFCWWL